MSSPHKPHDDQAHDKEFFRTFGMVLAALFGIFAFCIFAAGLIVPKHEASEAEKTRMASRLAPVGKVFTDASELAKAAPPKVQREPLTAEAVYAQVCAACHDAGVLAAPKTGDKAEWARRAAADGGLDGLTASAIKGKNQMPARGGNPDLSDDEVKASVKLILEKSGI